MRTILLLALVSLPAAAWADASQALRMAKDGHFAAAGNVRCAQEVGEALGPCTAEVSRATGSAAVVVTFGNGFSRMLSFSDGAFLRGNTTMSGTGKDTEWTLSDGLFEIRVDDQRFEIPEALVFGKAP